MTKHIKYWEWESPEAALDYLFEQAKADFLSPHGAVHVWLGIPANRQLLSKRSNGVAGAQYISRAMLEGRVYVVRFINDTIGIDWLDAVYCPKTYRYIRFPFI